MRRITCRLLTLDQPGNLLLDDRRIGEVVELQDLPQHLGFAIAAPLDRRQVIERQVRDQPPLRAVPSGGRSVFDGLVRQLTRWTGAAPSSVEVAVGIAERQHRRADRGSCTSPARR